jgi:esterase/lipase superfamily enzyme
MDVRISVWAAVTIWSLVSCHPLHAQQADQPPTVDKQPADADQASEAPAAPQPPADTQPPPDWAADVLADDPLAGKELITLEDLQRGLADDQQRRYVIERHFSRTKLSPEQQREFLLDAFQHPDVMVRRQAASELERSGELRDVVRELLLQWMDSGETPLMEAAIIGLQHLPLSNDELDQARLDSLLEALNSESPKVREAAARQLEQLGPSAVPILLEAMQDPQRREAADALSRMLAEQPVIVREQLQQAPRMPHAAPEVIVKSATPVKSDQALARQVEPSEAEVVRVYYGTNRAIASNPPDPKQSLLIWSAVFLVALLLSIRLFSRPRKKGSSWLGHLLRRIVAALVCIAAMVWSGMQCNAAVQNWLSARSGVQFAGRRSDGSQIHYGFCDVSIPPTHSVGEVERPLIGPEDEAKHVVLQRAALLEQPEFYAAINGVLDDLGDTSRDCLLYVHGYNVAFDDAAQRAAQIHFDLKFAGTTMFYSWPSRASMRHYFSDRNEIRFSHHLIKEFLAGVLENVDVDRFHIVAHSMGADALCQAIVELDPEGQVFDQIILAAPDIDADVFKQQILPRLEQCGHRTTLYCSQNDWALHASKHFNDSLRAGDSSNGPLTAAGLDTIDASEMDTELLGHSYYGNSLRLLDDLRLLIEQNRPPAERKLEKLLGVAGIPYWIFVD